MRRVLSLSPLLVLPVLIGHTVANSPTFPNGTERDDNGTNVDADASMSNSASLESYCSAQLNSFVATYQSTEIATSRWTWYEGFGPTDSLGDLTGSVTSQTYWTSTFLYTQYAIRAYTPKPPCCSSCYMTAGTIDFYFWPDQATPTAPAPGQPSTSVNAEGFTFTSPSVYMAFSSLVASNRCGQIGDAWTSTTIGFDASEITTARPITTLTQYESDYVSEGSTYRMMGSAVTTQPPPKSVNFDEVGQNCSAISGYVYWPDNPINAANAMYRDDPCHPVILLPPRLISMQQPWISASCGADPNLSGAYDPPRVLTPMLTGTELATPTANWGGRVNGDGDASPASSAETGAPSTTTRPISTGVTAVYESAKPSPSAEDASTATLTADAVTTAIVFSGQHVGTDSVTGMAGAILSGLGGGSGSGSGSSSDSGSDSEPGSESVFGSGSAASSSNAEESASKWNPTRAVDSSAITASPAISPSNSGSGKKISSSSSNNRGSSSASNTANGATSVAQAVATQSGAAAPVTFATNSAIWSFLAPIFLLWI
ncbi:hypothetical protein E4T52_01641 [Aureobasidium sp. EXF-3400]|nr:hypothetical protein E4T51_01524 [Aureobasidium sp. EXF-12344]KAI4783389.1 hypothetical protein E4T52_01641 [Aureobasidium sp. EXF-3400]